MVYDRTILALCLAHRGELVNYASGVVGVTVNALLPGPTHTENTDRLRAERARAAGITVAEIEAAFFRDLRPTSLLRRFTSADEVAALGVYLQRGRVRDLGCGHAGRWRCRQSDHVSTQVTIDNFDY